MKTGPMMSMLKDLKITNQYNFNNILFDEGDPVKEMYFLREGEVEISKLI